VSRRRARVERVEGIVFDCMLATTVTLVSTDELQEWLFAHPRELYYGVSLLHVIAVPVVIMAVVAGYGRSEKEMMKTGSGVLGWAMALFFCCSFIVPGVLGMTLDSQEWVMMVTIFGPIVLLFGGGALVAIAEQRGWIAPMKIGVAKPWWRVQALALLAWAYLLWMETLMLVAAAKGGVLAEVGLPMGVLVDYVPVRVMLYYVRDATKWEVMTIVASTLYLIVRLAMA
jgi:hypothetical protein